MKTFLKNLGFSAFEVDKLMQKHGETTLAMLEHPRGRRRLAKTVSADSVKAAHIQLCRIENRELFELLEPFGISSEQIYGMLMDHESAETCIEKIKADPYGLVFTLDVPFPAADALANSLSYKNAEQRRKAAVYSALLLAEKGVDEDDDTPLGEILNPISGSTCLPVGKLIAISGILLGCTDEDLIRDAAFRLHRNKLILLSRQNNTLYAFKNDAAYKEFFSAKKIRERQAMGLVDYGMNPYEAIDHAQAKLGMFLSYEQVRAVYSALTNRISVITGGPGTGKSATTKVLLEAYERLAGEKAKILLLAPTGQAARRLSQATGRPASTIHSALRITPNETDLKAGHALDADLIIVDETSMVDETIFSMLLRAASDEAVIIFVGDPNQLPSVGSGEVLTQLIDCVPVARLTKIFRQGDDSDIAYNAARVSIGTTQMIESNKFSFIECTGTAAIANAACDEYKRLIKEYGPENVIVLSPFRRHTKTCVNALNKVLRKAVSDGKKHNFIDVAGERIYENDKVIFLKNKFGLVNGDTGLVVKTWKSGCECKFGNKSLKLSGSELGWIIPAYAQTVHKAQGMEYPAVIVICDSMHKRMATRPIYFTALTRAKDKVVMIGEKAVFEQAVRTIPTHRYSCLATLVNTGG